ncbi:aspartate aminotransferase family protein [Taibaiella sp. KBW10]|uniref:pyridoxal phosphate-dependent decarboxylase family protein n=1 Tax=Taibaiella sp. KBW10 TaxID=2153357 RepID=UPI000F5B3D7B|nr:pyridoxal-dependent decarboxylase [Taibaiella sp. KBW10]RQO30513.1 aspartate aminotransferase family protein [Taibaiella sp. KBW10]
MQYWKKLSHEQQDARITEALEENIDYSKRVSLGVPASKLDGQVFYDKASFLKDAPLLRTVVQNPNHIGCHTITESEPFFRGTQKIEQELIETLAVDMFGAAVSSCDGYVATGGTEANIQAVWMYRNLFMQDYGATLQEIAILASTDTHYSVVKAANLLSIAYYPVAVEDDTRCIIPEALEQTIIQALTQGIKYVIVLNNMGTTMFGSIDNPDLYAAYLQKHNVPFKLHLDGAFGGFIYPTSHPENNLNFSNPHVSSITLDAHKMLQAPYGTGIFLSRKDLMKYVFTKEASYVHGMDITLCGSRSGANAIAVWMILYNYGPYGWLEKINTLLYRTEWCCHALDAMGIPYYRHPKMNIITIRAHAIPAQVAADFLLVPDAHEGNVNWYKIVVMDHVEIEHLQAFIGAVKAHQS